MGGRLHADYYVMVRERALMPEWLLLYLANHLGILHILGFRLGRHCFVWLKGEPVLPLISWALQQCCIKSVGGAAILGPTCSAMEPTCGGEVGRLALAALRTSTTQQ